MLTPLAQLTRESMRAGLTRENLHGVWAAIGTPFDARERFDEEVFRENIRRLHAAGVHGIYTTDSDGEFYAIELDEFRHIVDVFADETQRIGAAAMVGVTWCNTEGVVARLRHAVDRGILGAHVGHPFFMPSTAASYRGFWEDISAAAPDGFGLVQYNTPRCHNYLRGPDYAVLQRDFPKLIGTKHVGVDFTEFMSVMADAPQISHLVGEGVMAPYLMFGGRGINSWFTNFNPRFVLDLYNDVVAGRWDSARQRQKRLHAFIGAIDVLQETGNLHGIIGKAVTEASPFLISTPTTRRPYQPVVREAVERFRRIVEEQFQDLQWPGRG
ncbi:MAG: dihydrodipicolinate synthase family protein [Chloroflexi bacterium]|nr:dihydrodipicolinate synthase family protein [Chloroflexota bacterium]